MNGLRHQALLYEGPDDFLSATLPFVREGIADGDPVIAVADKPNADALRDALGEEARDVDIRYSHEWYASPGRAFSGFLGFACDHPDANWVRMIGEPPWPLGWRAGIAEYAHYESVFNVISKHKPIWALCPYDVTLLPGEILEHARATHPEIRTGTDSGTNPSYVDPDEYCSQLADRLSVPANGDRRFAVSSDYAALRAAVGAQAEAARVRGDRLADFLLAVHEVLVNARNHGDGPATLRSWAEERTFVCDVESSGPEVSEATAGYLPLDLTAASGRGLWLVRQLCDLVEIQSRNGRTSVRLHVQRG
jgi:anti-sigma regulatory factor (Ser/Thr protein kinase)